MPDVTANRRPGRSRFLIRSTALKVGGGGKWFLLPALLAVIVCALLLFSVIGPWPAATQDRLLDLPAPTGIAAVNGENPGEVIISWNPVAGAAFYRIAWIATADADAITENGGDWLDAIAYTNISPAADTDADADADADTDAGADANANTDDDADTGTQHTLARLNPGARYTFLVGSLRVKNGTPYWSAPAELNLTTGVLPYDPFRRSSVPVGLTANEPGAFGGYTLFAARDETPYLVDADGHLVHHWDAAEIIHARLLENGNLLGSDYDGTIYEINPAGNLLWEYRYPIWQHHDFLKLPNGNVLMIVRELKTQAEAVAAGANPAFVSPEGLNNERIIEVRPIYPDRAVVVWEWSLWDHLIQDYDPSKANYGNVSEHPELVDINYTLRQLSLTQRATKDDLLHANGLDYHPELDQVMFSARNMSEIWIIDHSTTIAEAAGHSGGKGGKGGDLLYRWGNPQTYRAGSFADQQLFWQHNPYWIPEGWPGAGNVLIFNNGDEYEGRYLDYSSVVEITLPASGYGYAMDAGGGVRYGPTQPVWTYTAENPPDFLSRRLSSAQRLPNGNTMVIDGLQGVIFEVTPDGATVWRYVNPVVGKGPIYQGGTIAVAQTAREQPGPFWRNALFRAYRYAPDYPGLQHYDLTPKGTVELYPDDGQ